MNRDSQGKVFFFLAGTTAIGLSLFCLFRPASFGLSLKVWDASPSMFSGPTLLWIAFVMQTGGFAHGMMGFGFPLIATPLLTLALPMKQTILVSGGIGLAAWAQTLPWVLLAAVTLVLGRRIHDRISTHTYMRWLRGFLWAMIILLVAQFVRRMAGRAL